MQVQSAFAAIIHRTITNHYKHLVAAGTQRMASPDAVALGKYVSMLSLAVEWKTDFSEPLSKLVLWLHTWNRHTADAADHVTADAAEDSSRRARKAKADEGGDGRKGGKKGRTAGSMLPTLPEYSLFFLIYILSHHDDFPTPEMLAEYSEKSVSGVRAPCLLPQRYDCVNGTCPLVVCAGIIRGSGVMKCSAVLFYVHQRHQNDCRRAPLVVRPTK